MHIRSAEFVISAASPKQFLQRPIPHFVFSGKSNVGKSSLLNRLLKRKALAKVSKTPGKTRQINYFLINDRFYFVDLPGYGYAKVSKREKAQWKGLIEAYLTDTPLITGIFQLIDIRHDPGQHDLQMLQWLEHHRLPYAIILTKADKLSRNQIRKQQHHLAKSFGLSVERAIPSSSSSGLGIDQIWKAIDDRLRMPHEE